MRLPSLWRLAALVIAIGATSAACTTGVRDGQAAYDAGDYAKAYEIWLTLAKAGNCKAQFALAELARTHRYIRRKEKWDGPWTWNPGLPFGMSTLVPYAAERFAFYWYLRAAEQGHVGARFQVAYYYDSLGGPEFVIPEFERKSEYWYRQAAASGDTYAMRIIANYDYEDHPAESLKWWLVMKALGVPSDYVDGNIESLKARLTAVQVLGAERRAGAWRAVGSPSCSTMD